MRSEIQFKRALACAAGAAAALLAGAAQSAGVPGQGTWETTLLGRDIDGNAVAASDATAVFLYDTTLDVTWLRDADVNGGLNWNAANTWVDTLMVGAYGGWRLPTMIDTDAPGCDYSYAGGTDCGYNVLTKTGDPTTYQPGQTVYSEMAHLYYVSLGNKAYCPPGDASCAGGPQPGWGLTNTGDFQNMQTALYWSGLQYAPNPGFAWYFYTYFGSQAEGNKVIGLRAMAVRPGDVAPVPEPQTLALMLAGVVALTLLKRRPS